MMAKLDRRKNLVSLASTNSSVYAVWVWVPGFIVVFNHLIIAFFFSLLILIDWKQQKIFFNKESHRTVFMNTWFYSSFIISISLGFIMNSINQSEVEWDYILWVTLFGVFFFISSLCIVLYGFKNPEVFIKPKHLRERE
ncbi:hypothetical protein [Seonamhaeicola sp.]|uniref:hypothetical protein n=1 Tax=Seonamhaeicola sp. TaxID=1912245 RepID=UPI00261DBF63|nr:hypothetical protein [Seonamhaeicola sp.]